MSRFALGNLFLLASMLSATVSHVMIKAMIDDLPSPLSWATIRPHLTGQTLVRGGVAGVLLGVAFGFWLLCLSRLSLSYAYPVASGSVVFVSLFSVMLLGEPVTPRMWVGTVLIMLGVILLRPVNA